jgi:hypothetical protein
MSIPIDAGMKVIRQDRANRNGAAPYAPPITFVRRLGHLILLAAGLGAAGPASAFTGADLLREVCLATFPHFDDAANRIAALQGKSISYDGKLFEQVDAAKRLSFTVNDGQDAEVDRFLIDIAWGSFNSLPASSCVIGDKKGFTLKELEEKFAIKQLLIRPEKVLYETAADAVAELPDGRRLWLTLWDLRPQGDPGPDTRIAVATLMSSEYLNGLMEKDR